MQSTTTVKEGFKNYNNYGAWLREKYHGQRVFKVTIDAVDFFKKMGKSLGDKRNELSPGHIAEITKVYGNFVPNEMSKIFYNRDFGYSKVTVERPERDAKGNVKTDKNGKPKADSSLRDTENIPLKDDIKAFIEREVLPHVPGAGLKYGKIFWRWSRKPKT